MAAQKQREMSLKLKSQDSFQCRVRSQLLDKEVVYMSHGSIMKNEHLCLFFKKNIKELPKVMTFNNLYHNLFSLLAEIH
jgi:hypothetical protein